MKKWKANIENGNQRVSDREDGDFLFHSRIAAISKNSVLQSIVEQLWAGMRRPLFQAICERVHLPENALRAAKDHRIILEAIAMGNAEAAQSRHATASGAGARRFAASAAATNKGGIMGFTRYLA